MVKMRKQIPSNNTQNFCFSLNNNEYVGRLFYEKITKTLIVATKQVYM